MVVEKDNSEEQTNDDGGNELEEGVEMKDVSVPEEITECKVEDSKEESITEVNGKEDDNFLADITLGTESPGEVVEANGDIEGETGDTDKKYSDIDAVRRVLIKSIDRKKTADDIEDYFFDNYSDCGIEDVFTCYLPGKKKWFNGAAIVTFENEAQAQKFMKMDFRKEETIGFRQKLYKICLADNKKKREERLKKFNEQKKKPEVNGAEVAKASCTIACVGFSGKMKGVADLQSYMQENHENVADIQIDQEKTFITFADQRSADRFLGLTYVKFKGAYIHRRYSEEVKRGEKRKHESTTEQQGGYQGAVKGAQFKLRGFKSSGTTYTVIKQGLEGVGVDKKDVKFVNYDVAQMEAVVRLQSNKAREVVMMLNKAGLTINGDRVSAQVLAGAEEDLYLSEIGKVRWDAKHKREFRPKKNDWSDY
eukprot:GFUD01006279.1.p1 GENE.GFUD01006279.1~~GFUD01006279.1.p1  ORF type:complete len:423 (-),score=133.73 GFUD01006279.1:75-1343(-)